MTSGLSQGQKDRLRAFRKHLLDNFLDGEGELVAGKYFCEDGHACILGEMARFMGDEDVVEQLRTYGGREITSPEVSTCGVEIAAFYGIGRGGVRTPLFVLHQLQSANDRSCITTRCRVKSALDILPNPDAPNTDELW